MFMLIPLLADRASVTKPISLVALSRQPLMRLTTVIGLRIVEGKQTFIQRLM